MAINSIFCMGALLLPISFGIPDSLSPFRPLKPVCSLDSIDAYYGNWKLIFPPAILENDWLTVTKSEFVWHEFDLNIDGWRKIKKRWRPRRDGADTLFAESHGTKVAFVKNCGLWTLLVPKKPYGWVSAGDLSSFRGPFALQPTD